MKPLETTKTDKERILLIGDSGTGKTRFIGTMPKPAIYDFDNGLGTLSHIPGVLSTQLDTSAKSWLTLKEELKKWATGLTLPYDAETVAVDSLTMAADAAMAYVLQKNNRNQPTIADWGDAIREVKDVLALLMVMSKRVNVVVTAHAQLVKDEVNGDIQWLPLIYGKDLPHRLGIFFDDVFMTTVVSTLKDAKKTNEYKLQVKPDSRMRILKTRLDPDGTKLSLYEEPNFVTLMKKANTLDTIKL